MLEEMIHHRIKESDEIENCPFCDADETDGLEILETPDHETWFVDCGDCMAQGPPGINREHAVEFWNDRVGKPPPGSKVLKDKTREELEAQVERLRDSRAFWKNKAKGYYARLEETGLTKPVAIQ